MFDELQEQNNVLNSDTKQKDENLSILNDALQTYSVEEESKRINKPDKNKKVFFIILFIFIILLSSSVFIFWYYKAEAMYLVYKMNFPWGTDIKNYSIKNTFEIQLPKKIIENFSLNLFSSDLINQDEINDIDFTKLESKLNIVNNDIEVQIQSKFGNKINLGFFLKYFFNNSIYLKTDLTKISPFLNIQDKWVYISLEDNSQFPINDYINDYMYKFFNFDKLKKNFNLLKFVDIKDPHENLKLNDHILKRINFKIKKGKSIDLLFYVMKEFAPEETYKNFYDSYEESKKKDDFEKSKAFFSHIENNLNVSIWINKKTKTIHRIDIFFENFDISKLNVSSDVDDLFSEKINISIGIEFNSLDNYKIEKPEEFISIEDFMSNLFNLDTNLLEDLEIIYDDVNVFKDTDKDGLLDIYEAMYNTDIYNPDTDGDGYLDGNEVIYGYDPLKNNARLNDDKDIFYFAYGSNMDFDRMKSRCGDKNFVGFNNSYLDDFMFYFYSRGYANIKPQESSRVYGVLYKINKQCLSGLDRAEGYPNMYQRQIVEINNPLGVFDAEVYIVQNDNSLGIPSQSYFETVINGATQNSLPSFYIQVIYSIYRDMNIYER